MREIYTSHEIILSQTEASSERQCLAIGFEPPENTSSGFGSLYLVAEIDSEIFENIQKKIIQLCGQGFYESATDDNFNQRFSSVLKNLNTKVLRDNPTTSILIVAIQFGRILAASANKNMLLSFNNRRGVSTVISPNEAKSIFSEIVEGKLVENQRLFLLSPTLANFLREKDIQIILSSTSLKKIPDRVKNLLAEKIDKLYSGIVIEAKTSTLNSQISSEKFSKTKKNIWSMVSDYLAKLSSIAKRKGLKIKTVVYQSTQATKQKIMPLVSEKTKHSWTNFWSNYINPYPKIAIIIVILTMIIIVFAIFITSSNFSNSNLAIKSYGSIQQLYKRAENSFQKQNFSSAREDLQNASRQFSGLSDQQLIVINEKSKTDKDIIPTSELRRAIQELLDKLDLTTRVNLSNSIEINTTKLDYLFLNGLELLGLDKSTGSIVQINPFSRTTVTKAQNNDLKSALSATKAPNNAGFLVLTPSRIWQYTYSSSSLTEQKVSAFTPGTGITSYLNNVYVLTPDQNQVFRFNKSNNVLSNKAGILKNAPAGSFNGSTSLVINGNVFVAHGRNILFFEGGEQRNYQVNNLPQNFSEIEQIIFTPIQNYFFVLDKDHSRIALLVAGLDSAEFKKQFILDNNKQINSFVIDETNKLLIIDTQNAIATTKYE